MLSKVFSRYLLARWKLGLDKSHYITGYCLSFSFAKFDFRFHNRKHPVTTTATVKNWSAGSASHSPFLPRSEGSMWIITSGPIKLSHSETTRDNVPLSQPREIRGTKQGDPQEQIAQGKKQDGMWARRWYIHNFPRKSPDSCLLPKLRPMFLSKEQIVEQNSS